jgi:hypothetical protein
MTFTETTAGELGATRQTWRTKSVRDLLAEILTVDPRATDRELLSKFVEHLREDDAYFLAAAEYAFDNALRALRREQNRPSAEQKAKRAAEKAKAAAEHAKLVSRIKSNVKLLTMRMPNGKPLADCSGAECSHFGGWYARVAAAVGPAKLVGEVLNEKQIRVLYHAT